MLATATVAVVVQGLVVVVGAVEAPEAPYRVRVGAVVVVELRLDEEIRKRHRYNDTALVRMSEESSSPWLLFLDTVTWFTVV